MQIDVLWLPAGHFQSVAASFEALLGMLLIKSRLAGNLLVPSGHIVAEFCCASGISERACTETLAVLLDRSGNRNGEFVIIAT